MLNDEEWQRLRPSVLHATAYFPNDAPVYVVGDIHGCFDEFKVCCRCCLLVVCLLSACCLLVV